MFSMNLKTPLRVAITGAAGQISYSLIFRILTGEMFGKNQPLIINLIDLPNALNSLKGLLMEIEDCAFPLLKKINITSDIRIGFENVNWALLIGSFPRSIGMQRKDLLHTNAHIFAKQGFFLEKVASSDVKILVIGNPCNTNCYVAMKNAPSIPKNRWFAMTRLDENRAKFQLYKKSLCDSVSDVNNITIWGNHSNKQYPDFYNAKIKDLTIMEVIKDHDWLHNDFINIVQNRGLSILESRGKSSSASAANAIIDTVHSLTIKHQKNNWNSIALCSDGSYDIEPGYIVSMPFQFDGTNYNIVQNLKINEFSRIKIKNSIDEIKEEANLVKDLFYK